MKLLLLLAAAVVACRLLVGRWPWEFRMITRNSAAEARARALLGISEHASHAQIVAAHRALIARVHPDRGGSSEEVLMADAARDVLLGSLARKTLEKP